jgi:hypothetical protein
MDENTRIYLQAAASRNTAMERKLDYFQNLKSTNEMKGFEKEIEYDA